MRHTLNSELSALIDVIIERFGQSGINRPITGYFDIQYSYLLGVIPKDLISHLPIEDQFFIDLFDKVLLPSARKKVCHQRQQIRAGLISNEAARESIPRKDLGLAALKKKYRDAEAKDTSPENMNTDPSNLQDRTRL